MSNEAKKNIKSENLNPNFLPNENKNDSEKSRTEIIKTYPFSYMKLNKDKAFISQRVSTPMDIYKEKNSIFNIPGFMIDSNNFQGKLNRLATTNEKNKNTKYELNQNDSNFIKSENCGREISIDEFKIDDVTYNIKEPEITDKANKNFNLEKIEKKQSKIKIDNLINYKLKKENKYEEDNIENNPKMNLNISAIHKKDIEEFNDDYVISDSFDSIDSFKVNQFKKNLVKDNVFYGFNKNIQRRDKQDQKHLSKSFGYYNYKNQSNSKSNKLSNNPLNILPRIGNTKETNDTKSYNLNKFFFSYVLKLTNKQADVKITEKNRDNIPPQEDNLEDIENYKNKNCIDSIGIEEHKDFLINNNNIDNVDNENNNSKSIIVKRNKNDNLLSYINKNNAYINHQTNHHPESSRNSKVRNFNKNSKIYNSDKKYKINCQISGLQDFQANEGSEQIKKRIKLSSKINPEIEKDLILLTEDENNNQCRDIQVKDDEGINENIIENYLELCNDKIIKENIVDTENKNNLFILNENKMFRKETKPKSKHSFKSDLKLITKSSIKIDGNFIPQNKTTQNKTKNTEEKKTLLKKNIQIINSNININTNNKIKLVNINKLEEKFEILKKTNKPKFQVVHKFGGGLIKSLRKIDKETNLMIDFLDKTKCRSHSKISDLKIFHKEKKFNK